MHVITCINPHTESNDLVLILYQGKKICKNKSKHNKDIIKVYPAYAQKPAPTTCRRHDEKRLWTQLMI